MNHVLFLKKKRPLERWVLQYLDERNVPSHKSWLLDFAEVCTKDIADLQIEDLVAYAQSVDQHYQTQWARGSASRALACFMKYMRGQGHKYLPIIYSEELSRVCPDWKTS